MSDAWTRARQQAAKLGEARRERDAAAIVLRDASKMTAMAWYAWEGCAAENKKAHDAYAAAEQAAEDAFKALSDAIDHDCVAAKLIEGGLARDPVGDA